MRKECYKVSARGMNNPHIDVIGGMWYYDTVAATFCGAVIGFR